MGCSLGTFERVFFSKARILAIDRETAKWISLSVSWIIVDHSLWISQEKNGIWILAAGSSWLVGMRRSAGLRCIVASITARLLSACRTSALRSSKGLSRDRIPRPALTTTSISLMLSSLDSESSTCRSSWVPVSKIRSNCSKSSRSWCLDCWVARMRLSTNWAAKVEAGGSAIGCMPILATTERAPLGRADGVILVQGQCLINYVFDHDDTP